MVILKKQFINFFVATFWYGLDMIYIDGLVQDCSDSIANALDCDVKLQDNEDYIIRRNISERNKIYFRNAIANLDWDEMYHETDTQSAFSLFHSTFLKLYNVHFPKQKLKMKYNTRKMWLSQK